jgi:hypothetical protein
MVTACRAGTDNVVGSAPASDARASVTTFAIGVLVADGLVPVYATPARGRTGSLPLLAAPILTQPGLTQTWVKIRKVNECTIRLRMVSPIWSVVAEIDEARLVGMECKSIPCKALTQNAEEPLGIEEVLERQHGWPNR